MSARVDAESFKEMEEMLMVKFQMGDNLDAATPTDGV